MVQSISTGTFCPSKWVVDPIVSQGTHTTIAAAMVSASSGDTISLRPGTYGSFTWKSGVAITAWGGDAYNPNVTITGPITISASSFNCSLAGVNLVTTGANVFNISSAGNLHITNCNMSISSNSVISATGGAQVFIANCQGDTVAAGTGNIFSISNGQIFISNSRIFNITGTASDNTLPTGTGASKFFISNSYLPGWDFDISAANSFNVINSVIGEIVIAGTATNNNIYNSVVGNLTIGVNCGITVMNTVLMSSTSEPAINGSGTLMAAGLTFTGTRQVAASVAQTPAFTYGNQSITNVGTPANAGVNTYVGTGSPNGVITALQGSLYYRIDGSTSNTRAYINNSAGSGNTWTAIVTVA